jgi:hypothetical protein
MTTPGQASFFNDIYDVKTIQAPNPATLSTFDDRSRFAGAGNQVNGNLLTWRGVITADFGQVDYIQDESGGLRSGVAVFAPPKFLVPGRKYLIAGRMQEFFNETEAAGIIDVVDEGVGTIPAPISEEPIGSGDPLTISTVTDTVTDQLQNTLTGEDYEGVLVTMPHVRAFQGAPFPGAFFDVDGNPYPTVEDTINIDNDGPWTYEPADMEVLSITGVVNFNFGEFVIDPRTNADFSAHYVGVEDESPRKLSFSVHPNPARVQTLTFGLPRDLDIEIAVFDLAGRRLTTLAKGHFVAGAHSVRWDGRDASGNLQGAGVFFYRLIAGEDVMNIRGVRIE